ncbi:MAG: DNA-formamidopyrimidine glycosylase, partial [Dehalococcoidia bacterium]|nr:DNA-formamidopyrimidine glycosylase [Dehalococcoidia bacterium]
MPELPEVETIVRELSDLTEASIEQVQVVDPRLDLPLNEIVGTKIKKIERQGKYIVFRLSG